MTDVATMPEPAPEGRGLSFWGNAWARLRRNRLAMASLVYLVLMVLACVFGPMLAPNSYDRIFQSYTNEPASLASHPRAEAVGPAFEAAARRARLEVTDWRREGDVIHATLATGGRAVDPRAARYFDRSDLFEGTELIPGDADTAQLTTRIERHRFLFGTDATGRDLMARTLIAGRVSLSIGLLSGLVAMVIGVLYGAISGFAGRITDQVMMRIVDVLYSLPFIFFVIMLVVFFGRNFLLMFVAVGAVLWLDMARIVRGQTLSLRRREFVEAAEALGVSWSRILIRHIVPNLLGPVIVFMTLLVPNVIILESFLSYLGFGVQEPMSSWGVLIAQGARAMPSANWMLLFPSLFLISTLFALNFLGDGLRDALDPRDH
ncbi:ABC transporter permease [Pseudodonghicola xiamenensis]|uniref:Oligopeptide transport system permease protein OppC n=1 Tax=Pseudodonghicola xiamenensis TaxID=337702 RepID=A0A8J3MD25_9RHOB|nr:ABC transporter permease subunit [Pseudodonghicola xiamenensis]GHG92951.1 peptide ABC transporter permease [Pseudodonghicola xiamenensis]